MNIIILLKGVTKSSAGIVFERLLEELVQNHKLNIFFIFGSREVQNSHLEIVSANCSPDASSLKYKLKLILLNQEVNQGKWSEFVLNHISRHGLKARTEAVLCLTSGGSFEELYTARAVSESLNIPYHIHTIDAIPPPPWWGENKILNWAKRRYARRFFASAASFSAISRKMVEYQEALSQRKANAVHPVIPNPVSKTFVEKENDYSNEHKPIRLLYLGKLNKTRNGKALIDAIQILNKENVIAQLDIVGLGKDKFLSNLDLTGVPDNIHLESWTDNPEKRIASADILVDIDIADERDVFISGKLLTYLCSNIPILSVTTSNSPSSELLSSQEYGVTTVGHNPEQIVKSIRKLMRVDDYGKVAKEREILLSKLSSKSISNALVENIVSMVS